MTQEDLELIIYWQKWRRDDSGELEMPNPKKVGIALDKMIKYCEMCMKLNEDAENRR
jgi:hypothetical protein